MKNLIIKTLIVLMLPIVSSINSVAFANTGFSALVVEPKTGKVIYEHNANHRRYPASLTKMMTLYILFEELSKNRISMNQRINITQKAALAECSCLRLKSGKRLQPGASITVETAIKALIVQSANDVATSVAAFISGSEDQFAIRMNQTAKKLGMKNTNFMNAHGLPHDNQYTTAQDMATLGVALYNHFPKYYPMFKLTAFQFDGREIRGHNRVNQRLDGADGIKTGYIRKSGSNLVTSAQRGDIRLFAVVIGGRNTAYRDDIMVDIVDASFDALKRNSRNPTISPRIMEDMLVGYDPKKNPKPGIVNSSNHKNSVQIVSNDITPDIPTIKLISSQAQNINPAILKSPASIQVGAYKNRKSAQERARLAHRKLKQGTIDIVLIDNLYRARISGFNYENATHACNQLKQSGNDCLVIKK